MVCLGVNSALLMVNTAPGVCARPGQSCRVPKVGNSLLLGLTGIWDLFCGTHFPGLVAVPLSLCAVNGSTCSFFPPGTSD